jgi:hypothetical protein
MLKALFGMASHSTSSSRGANAVTTNGPDNGQHPNSTNAAGRTDDPSARAFLPTFGL